MAYYDIYPTLRAAAGHNNNNLQKKFPFLCDLEPLIQAISGSTLLSSGDRNPNGYNKYELAEKIIDYIDRFFDYSSGKIPKAFQVAVDNGYIMSQTKFWDNASSGFYIIPEDPGYGTNGLTKTGSGHHYLTAPSTINETAPNGGYHSNPLPFNITTTLYTSSFIEYVDNGLTSGGLPIVNTTDTGITSDDIVGVSWGLTGLTGLDTSDATLDLTAWHYPMGIPGVSKTYVGRRVDFETSNQVAGALSATQGEIDAQKFNLGYTGNPELTEYVGNYIAPYVHFAEDSGFSNKVNSLVGDAGDVAPQYKFVSIPYTIPLKTTIPTWDRARDTYVDFDIFSMTSTNDDVIPSSATLTGIYNGSIYTGNNDVDITPLSGDHWKPNATGDGDLTFFLNSTANKLQTKARSSDTYTFYGIPYYQIQVRYTDGGTQSERTFNIPFHYLTQWTLGNTSMGVSLANETAGITGDCSADYTQAGGTTSTAVGRQGPFSVDTMTIENTGRGYAYNQAVSASFPYGDGRHYQSILGGPLLSVRSNNNPAFPKNSSSRAIVLVDNADYAQPRVADIITHGSGYLGVDSYSYEERGFLGADYQYEKDNYAVRYALDGAGSITGLNYTDYTENTTAGKPEAPGLEYGTRTYHATQNPYGDDTSYVSHTFGAGEADDRWFAKSKGSFDITVANGRVTAVTPRSRDDGNGVACEGGWGSPTDQYSELTLFDANGGLPDEAIRPVIKVRSNFPADNGVGNKVVFDINDANNEFYPGKNIPDGQYAYGFAYHQADGYANGVSDDFDMPNWYDRNWITDIDPSAVRIKVERPVLTTQTRSLKTKSVGTGAHRYTFEVEYPPMTQEEATNVIRLHDQLKGPTQAIQLRIPKTAVQYIEGWASDNAPGMAEILGVDGSPGVGVNELTLDGFEANKSVSIPEGTLFTGMTIDKIYQVVDSTSTDAYGRAKILIEPPLVSSIGSTIRGRASNQARSEYWHIKAFISDDTIEYRVDAAGLYRLQPIKFREALKDE